MTTQDHNPIARYISRFLALRIVVKSTYTKEVDGRIVTVPGKDIRFQEGVFETADPDLIKFLESDKSFGTTYIRVPDNVVDAVKDRGEWMKDLEQKEKDLIAREAALKAKEAKVSSNEEGARTGDGLKANMPKAKLLEIAEAEGATKGLTSESKNADIIAAIRANRADKGGDASDKSDGSEDNKAF